MDMRVLFTAAVSLLALAACGNPAPAAPTAEEVVKASAEINAWFDVEYEEELQMSPIGLTFQGRKDQYDKIDDYSEAAIDRKLEWRRASVAEMKEKFDPAKLDEEARTSFDIWALSLDMEEKAAKFRRSPYIFVKDGPHVFLPQFVMQFHEVSEKSDMDAYVVRIGEVGRAIDQSLELAKLAAAEGNRAPRFAYDETVTQSTNVITGAPFGDGPDSPIWADVKAELSKLQDGGSITADDARAIETAAKAALIDKLKPAYERMIAWLKEDRPNTSEQAQGAAALKDGVAFYDNALAQQTTVAMTAAEIHDLGLAEVKRIHGEMEKIKEQVGFKGTLLEFFDFMRTSPQFQLPNNDEGRAQYIKMSEDYLAAMTAKLPEYFGILPKAQLVVKRVEAFREEAGGAQHYFPSTPDGSRPGVYYAHLSDMKSMPTYSMEAIAYHEGVPGHHMQIAIAQELQGIPKFRTQYGYTAYAEGWGLYSEALSKDMGFYKDPYSDMGRLGAEIWRAIRLVVDTGIHSKGWSEQQAVDYFLANGPTPRGAVESEVKRYIVWPGQATAYKIGMIRIQELRAMAQKELGDKFTMAGFHDTVLGGGMLPLPVLEQRVKRWVEKVKAQ
jgi:uncharacterized protein (DUF885 family)